MKRVSRAAVVILASLSGLSCEKNSRKPTLPLGAETTVVNLISPTFDARNLSTPRFKVDYMEPLLIPPISELPAFVPQRELIIKNYQAAAKNGATEKELSQFRQRHFEVSMYPILVSDAQTGNTYELQSDRRSIVAKRPSGHIIWIVNPFSDAKLDSYRVDHPYIHAFGDTQNYSDIKGGVLGIAFNSSQFGDIELETGRFHFQGQD